VLGRPTTETSLDSCDLDEGGKQDGATLLSVLCKVARWIAGICGSGLDRRGRCRRRKTRERTQRSRLQAAGPRNPRSSWHHGRRLHSVWTFRLCLSTTANPTRPGRPAPSRILAAFLVLVSAKSDILVQEVVPFGRAAVGTSSQANAKPTRSCWGFGQIEELPLLLVHGNGIPTARVTSPICVSNAAVNLSRLFYGSLTPLDHRPPFATVSRYAEHENIGARQPVASPRDLLPGDFGFQRH